MASKNRKQAKAKARERAKKQQKAAASRARQGGLVTQVERVAGWPLLHCEVNEDWRERSALAQVLVSRSGGHAVATAMFLVDLQCLGLKNCFAKPSQTRTEYRELRARLSAHENRVDCDPSLAAAIIYAGIDYAAELGFAPNADFRIAERMIRDFDPQSCEIDIPCGGKDGKPMLVCGPNDDPGRIIARLEDRLGAGGFNYIAPIGLPFEE